MCGQRMYEKFMTVEGTRKDSSEELQFFQLGITVVKIAIEVSGLF